MGLIEPGNLFYITSKIAGKSGDRKEPATYKEALLRTEKEIIIKALEEAGGNRSKAIKLLDMNRTSFYNKLKELGIS
jgi:DNA-binding NtrC family response regulator